MEPKKTLLAAGLILALSLAAYSNSFHAEFQFDDFHQVVTNGYIRSLGNLPKFFTDGSTITQLRGPVGFRPLTTASFALNYYLTGYGVWSYHCLNFLLHFLCAFLVFLVVRAVLDDSGMEDAYTVSLAAALIFALHPIQTGAVTYISSRALLLASFFCLLSFYGFLRYRGGRGRMWIVVAPVSFMLGLLSKEIAVSLLSLMLAYDFLVTVPARGGYTAARRVWVCYVPFIVALGIYLVWRKAVTGLVSPASTGIGAGWYIVSEARAWLLYLRLLVFPMNQNADYFIPVSNGIDAHFIAALLVIIASVAFSFRLRKKSPHAAFFAAWFLLAVLPESTLVPLPDIAVEYRLYLPSAGFIAASVLIISASLKKPAAGRWAVISVVVLLSVLTFNRNAVWATDYTLWNDVAAKSPASARAHLNLGKALVGVERYADAEREFMASLVADPYYPERYLIYADLGLCYFRQGMIDKAIGVLSEVVRTYPRFIEAYTDLGNAYLAAGRYGEAADVLSRAAAADPRSARTRIVLAQTYAKMGRADEAVLQARDALRLAPDEGQRKYAESLLSELEGSRADR